MSIYVYIYIPSTACHDCVRMKTIPLLCVLTVRRGNSRQVILRFLEYLLDHQTYWNITTYNDLYWILNVGTNTVATIQNTRIIPWARWWNEETNKLRFCINNQSVGTGNGSKWARGGTFRQWWHRDWGETRAGGVREGGEGVAIVHQVEVHRVDPPGLVNARDHHLQKTHAEMGLRQRDMWTCHVDHPNS